MPAARAAAVRKTPEPIRTLSGPLTVEQIRKMSDADYMNEAQLDFFRQMLLKQRSEIVERLNTMRAEMVDGSEPFADVADRASAEEERALAFLLREREVFLLGKIDASLKSIGDGTYGYCTKTGNEIGIPRMLARPTATECIQVKEIGERQEAHFRMR